MLSSFLFLARRCGARTGSSESFPPAFSAILLFVSSVGWCWPVFSELRSAVFVSPAEASIQPHISHCQRLNRCRGKAGSETGKLDPSSSSTHAPSANPHVTGTGLGRETLARIVAREWSSLQTRVAERGRAPVNAAKEPKPDLKFSGPACVARTRRTARGSHSVAHLIQRRRTDKSRPQKTRRTEPLTDTGRRARSRISEARA